MAKKRKKSKPPRRVSRVKKRKSKKRRRRAPISSAAVRRLGYECENLAEADKKSGIRYNLAKVLGRHPNLKAAWERGQFLRNLQDLAGVVATVSEAAHKLGLVSGEQLRDMLDTDDEIANVWNQTRLNTIIEARAALLDAAKEGNQTAIRAVENYLREEKQTAARVDTVRLRQSELCELLGVTRVTITDWEKRQALPRNADKTYNLAEVIRWYQEFVKSKAGGKILPADELRNLKTEEKRLNLMERRHQLLSREEVIEGLVGRWQAIVGAFRYKRRELASMVHGQTVDRIEDILSRFFEDIQRQWLQIPEVLHLPDAAAAKLAELFGMISETTN